MAEVIQVEVEMRLGNYITVLARCGNHLMQNAIEQQFERQTRAAAGRRNTE